MLRIGSSVSTFPISILAVQFQTLKCFGSSFGTRTPVAFSVPNFKEFNIVNPTVKRQILPTFRYTQDPSRNPKDWNEVCRHAHVNPRIQLEQVGTSAENFLGNHKFSVSSSLDTIFGNFNEVINLFTLRNSHEEHPLLFLSRLLEAVAKYRSGTGDMVNPYPLWISMMTLLVTEMFGYSGPEEVANTRADRHVRMAKIAETAYITQQIHKRILDSESFPIPQNSTLTKAQRRHRIAELHSANKTATLVGDLLWAQICANMAALKCQTVSELICEFLMDYCEGEFEFNQSTNEKRLQTSTDSWIHKTQLGLGSIMGTTISATLLFSGHQGYIREVGYKLGVLLALTYQVYVDIMFFQKKTLDVSHWLDMGLLPVVHKIKKDPHLAKESPSDIFQEVRSDTAILAESLKTLRILQEDTLSSIAQLSEIIASQKARTLLEQCVVGFSPS